MWIGYLQLGPSEHGIYRYGKLLAAEGRRRERLGLTITEVSINLTKDRKTNREMLINAARQLSEVDIIHVQYSGKNNQPLWGSRWEALYYFWIFKYHCSRPIVVTLHDVYEPTLSIKTGLKQVYQSLKNFTLKINKNKNDFVKLSKLSPDLMFSAQAIKVVKRMYGKNAIAFRWLLNQVNLVFVCSWEEAKRLQSIANVEKTKVVPHFVEDRQITSTKAEARAKLKLTGGKIITILGFIHGRKGYQLMVEAIPKLPQDVKVVFAGKASPGNEEFVQKLIQLTKAQSVGDRLTITGYLSEEQLQNYLIATDLAICPFKFFSASGSLSTWISAARPILAYDLPQITEYNSLEPEAIKTFHPYESDALAEAIIQLLPATYQDNNPAIARLKEKLSITKIFDEQLNYYQQIIPPSSRTSTYFETLKY